MGPGVCGANLPPRGGGHVDEGEGQEFFLLRAWLGKKKKNPPLFELTVGPALREGEGLWEHYERNLFRPPHFRSWAQVGLCPNFFFGMGVRFWGRSGKTGSLCGIFLDVFACDGRFFFLFFSFLVFLFWLSAFFCPLRSSQRLNSVYS